MSDQSTAIVQSQTTQVARVKSAVPAWDSDCFEHAQRVARVLAKSSLVPQHLRGEEHIPDLVLLCLMAQARNEHPLALAQHVYFVSGRAGYAASYLIAQANMSGRFRGPITWETAGQGAGLVVTASAIIAATGQIVTASASMAMAVEEGWAKNPKYKTMPQQMLSYRSATALIRLYAPEVIMAGGGLPPVEEIEPLSAEPPAKVRSAAERAGLIQAAAPVVDVTPEPDPEIESLRARAQDGNLAVLGGDLQVATRINAAVAARDKAGLLAIIVEINRAADAPAKE